MKKREKMTAKLAAWVQCFMSLENILSYSNVYNHSDIYIYIYTFIYI